MRPSLPALCRSNLLLGVDAAHPAIRAGAATFSRGDQTMARASLLNDAFVSVVVIRCFGSHVRKEAEISSYPCRRRWAGWCLIRYSHFLDKLPVVVRWRG